MPLLAHYTTRVVEFLSEITWMRVLKLKSSPSGILGRIRRPYHGKDYFMSSLLKVVLWTERPKVIDYVIMDFWMASGW